jgi:hypothetical protein
MGRTDYWITEAFIEDHDNLDNTLPRVAASWRGKMISTSDKFVLIQYENKVFRVNVENYDSIKSTHNSY